MSFVANKENSKTLYTGYAIMKVNGVKIELKNDKQLLTFDLESKDGKISTKLDFFLEPILVESKTGKKQFIDAFGRAKYFEAAVESSEYFDAKTARQAIRGEEEVTAFIAALANVKKNENARFDDFMAIAKGDIAQIEAILKVVPNNNVGVVLGVRQNKYQSVYTRVFGRGWMLDAGSRFEKTLGNETSTANYYGKAPYTLSEYDPETVQPTPEDQLIPSNPSMPEFNFGQPATIAEAFPDSTIETKNDVFSSTVAPF